MFARTGAPKPIEESCRLVRMIDTFIADSFEKKKLVEEGEKQEMIRGMIHLVTSLKWFFPDQ